VSACDDHIIRFEELVVQTPFSVDIMFDEADRLSAGWERFSIIAVLQSSERPDSATRAVLKERFRRMRPRLVHLIVVSGSNVVMRAVARLIGFAMGIPTSVHDSETEAFRVVQHDHAS